MEPREFLKIAGDKLSGDPYSRLSPLAESALRNPECIIDVHAHIFDKRCLTVGYILLRLLKSRILENIGLEFYSDDNLLNKNEDEIYNFIRSGKPENESGWQQLESELESVNEFAETAEIFGFEIKEALRVLKKRSMLEVLDNYIEKFSITQLPEFAHRPFVAGVLLMDLETGWRIKPKKKLSRQLSEIKSILQKRPVLPFFPIDPRRAGHTGRSANLYELFLDAFADNETPFFGVKCYPSLGYLPADTRIDPIFSICAEKNIPILTHCGGEIVSTFDKEIELYEESGITHFTIPGNSRTERARYLNDPDLWIPVLEKYKNLKLCFGHFGGDANWENHDQTRNNQRITRIIELMKNQQYNIYADFSYNVAERELYHAFQNELNSSEEVAGKTMFGTDYWVVLPAGDLLEREREFLMQLTDHKNSLLNKAPLRYLLS